MTKSPRLVLGFDTETTGLYMPKKPLTDESQPSLMQLSIQVKNLAGEAVHTLTTVVVPEKAPHPAAVETHGITLEYANAVGITERLAVTLFNRFLMLEPEYHVAHNLPFDFGVLNACAARHGITLAWEAAGLAVDTCAKMGPICKVPPTEKMRRFRPDLKWKNPNLSEALMHTHGRVVEGAHDAGADTAACLDVFFWLLEGGHL